MHGIEWVSLWLMICGLGMGACARYLVIVYGEQREGRSESKAHSQSLPLHPRVLFLHSFFVVKPFHAAGGAPYGGCQGPSQ